MKALLFSFVIFYSLFAGTYDYNYSFTQNNKSTLDEFMYGNFLSIERFDRIDFSDEEVSQNSTKLLDKIALQIKDDIKNAKKIKVKIIGHASQDYSDEEAKEYSKLFANEVYSYLCLQNIDKSIFVVEHRKSKDQAFSPDSTQSIKRSNRVMVTIYEFKENEKDSDLDTVLDSIDECPNTPTGVKVNALGCSLDSDKDGVKDYLDLCPNTPKGVKVDEQGCPYDSDGDKVLDYKDKCPETQEGLRVDDVGCPIQRELKLNFAIDSYEIPQESYNQIDQFADFMKKNLAYSARIIGHTDSVGKSSYNMTLSFNRANSVKNALVKKGIDVNRLEAVGKGELEPLQTNRSSTGRSANRRIEVTLFY